MEHEVVDQIRDFGNRLDDLEGSRQWHSYASYYSSIKGLGEKIPSPLDGNFLRFNIVDEASGETDILVEIESEYNGLQIHISTGNTSDTELFKLAQIDLPESGDMARADSDGSSDITFTYGASYEEFKMNREHFDEVTPSPVPSRLPEEIQIAVAILAEAEKHLTMVEAT